jgi:hypothetical protein
MRLVLGLTAALLCTSGALADDPLLTRLVGDWTGRGSMKTSAEAEAERVYCKVANRLSEDGNTLLQSGRCSLASNSGPIDGTISAVGSDLYAGTLNSLASRGPTTVAGSASGNRLELNAEFVDAFDGKPARAVIVLDVGAGGYRLTSTRSDPETGTQYTANEIVFSQ